MYGATPVPLHPISSPGDGGRRDRLRPGGRVHRRRGPALAGRNGREPVRRRHAFADHRDQARQPERALELEPVHAGEFPAEVDRDVVAREVIWIRDGRPAQPGKGLFGPFTNRGGARDAQNCGNSNRSGARAYQPYRS